MPSNNKIKNRQYASNMSMMMEYNALLPKRMKKKAVLLTPSQFYSKLEMAKKFYVYGFRKFSVNDLKIKYNLKLSQANELFKELSKFVEEFKKGQFGVVNNIPQSTPMRVIPSLEERLLNIRTRHKSEIKHHGEQVSFPEGFIYMIKNPVWDGWIKVGMTIDYKMRLNSYNSTYDPHNKYTFIEVKWVTDRRKAENELINKLSDMSIKRNGEWFNISEIEALEIFNN